jgi:hypothetical protein
MSKSDLTTYYYLDKLLVDPSFVELLDNSLEDVITNEKIAAFDIPQIIQIIIILIQQTTTVVINEKFLGGAIKKLVQFLIRRYNIGIDDNEIAIMDEVIDSSLTLLFTNPILKKSCC